MTFYSPSHSGFSRTYREEVQIVLSGIDCVLHREHVIYCSSELTTGARLYNALRQYNLKTAKQLKQLMGESWFKATILEPNVNSAIEFAEAVRCSFPERTIVVTPAPFGAPGWSQHEYLAFWEELLRSRIKSAWFNRNWEFSNGCAFEFAVAHDAGLPTFDQGGNTIDLRAGIRALEAAVEALESEGIPCVKLRENLERLQAVRVGNEAPLRP
jgi:hypothetical protein